MTQALAETGMRGSSQVSLTADAVRAAGPNVANINKLIETLRTIKPARFNMSAWAVDGEEWPVKPADLLANRGPCGTCGCIGGWANAVFETERGPELAAAALGLSEDDSEALFYPRGVSPDIWERITRRQAIRVLEHLRDTGEVDWSKRGRR